MTTEIEKLEASLKNIEQGSIYGFMTLKDSFDTILLAAKAHLEHLKSRKPVGAGDGDTYVVMGNPYIVKED